MKISAWRVGAFVGLIALAIIQNMPWFSLFAVKPNIVFVALMILAVMAERLVFFLGVLFASLLVLFNVFFFSWAAAVAAIWGIVGYMLVQRLPWRTSINIVSVIALGTAGFYILIDPIFIFREFPAVALELLFNMLFGVLLYGVLIRRRAVLGSI